MKYPIKRNSTLHSQAPWVKVPTHDLDGVRINPEVLAVRPQVEVWFWRLGWRWGTTGCHPQSLSSCEEIKQSTRASSAWDMVHRALFGVH